MITIRNTYNIIIRDNSLSYFNNRFIDEFITNLHIRHESRYFYYCANYASINQWRRAYKGVVMSNKRAQSDKSLGGVSTVGSFNERLVPPTSAESRAK